MKKLSKFEIDNYINLEIKTKYYNNKYGCEL